MLVDCILQSIQRRSELRAETEYRVESGISIPGVNRVRLLLGPLIDSGKSSGFEIPNISTSTYTFNTEAEQMYLMKTI